MNLKEEEISKLKALLDSYKAQHGDVTEEMCQVSNCVSCAGSCTGLCAVQCTSCSGRCDGNSGSCWKMRWR